MKKSRRQFISGISKAALSIPLINLPWTKSAFAMDAQKKAIFMYMPDGCIPSRFHPSGSETNFSLGDQTNPLESVKQHCVFPSNLTMYEQPSGHEAVQKILSANADQTLDYFLGQQLGQNTPFKSLHLGVASNFQSNSEKSISLLPGRIPISANDNPLNAFDSIFGNDAGGTDEQRRLNSILDSSRDDLNRLRSNLGTAEAEKLEKHEQAIFEVEQRLLNSGGSACNLTGWNPDGFTIPPGGEYPPHIHRNENFDTIAKLQMDLVVRALSCQMTRVASLTFSHSVSPLRLPGLSTGNHNASHYGQPNSNLANTFSDYKRYFVSQLKYLIDALQAEQDSDGSSLLSNTLIFFFSELGDSDRHDNKNMPFILAGQAGGALSTGRYLDFGGDSHAKLLVSIANMMDVNIDEFGYTGEGKGGLPGL